jgi:hypothetical protein
VPSLLSLMQADAEGDRRAYYETSQWTIKQNRETLAAAKVCTSVAGLRSPSLAPQAEGKLLRAELAKLHSVKSAASSVRLRPLPGTASCAAQRVPSLDRPPLPVRRTRLSLPACPAT